MIAPDDHAQAGPWWRRIAWMAAIWGMSVAVLGAVAMVLRYWLAL